MGKTVRRILFEFDSLIDIQIGFVRYLQLHHKDILIDHIKDTTLEEICEARMTTRYFALNMMRISNSGDNLDYLRLYSEIFDEVCNNHYEELISLSPKIPQTKQIISIYDDPEYSMYMDCHLLGRTQQEVDVLRKEFPGHTIHHVSWGEEFDYSNYARVFIGSFNYLEDMKDTTFTHITVLSYPDNFELIRDAEGKVIRKINTNALTLLGETNQFELLEVKF